MRNIKKRLIADIDPFLGPAFSDVFDLRPLIIYDAGAAGSVYCPIKSGPCQRVNIYGFEPVKQSYDKLARMYANNPYVDCLQVALANEDGTVTLNQFDGNETLSSLYARDELDLSSRAVEVDSARLDSVPERFGFPVPDFIKLDTEGSEADILEGGGKLLDQEVLGVLTEVSFWRSDTGGAVFSEIDTLLTKAGFVLFDLQVNRSHFSTVGGKKDKLRTGDALYLRDFTQLSERLSPATDEQKRTKLLKLVSLCVSWCYLNYALELIEHGRDQNLISPEEFSLLSDAFVSTVDLSARIPNFPGRAAVSRFADLLSYAFHPHAKKGTPTLINGIGNPPPFSRKGARPGKIEIYQPIISNGASQHIKSIDLDQE